MRTTCCVLFNHPYPKNIPVLKDIFSGLFHNLKFVQPVVHSADKDVWTSYAGSFSFHALIFDVGQQLLETGSDFFVFIQDDVVLNPFFNGDELITRLQVQGNGAFLPSFGPMSGDVQDWYWTGSTLLKIFYPRNVISGSGFEDLFRYLPDAQKLKLELMTKYHFEWRPITYNRNRTEVQPYSVFADRLKSSAAIFALLDGLFATAPNGEVTLPYPLLSGISDFFVVDRSTLIKMLPLLGIMKAAGLFAEVAIPTALAAAAPKVIQSKDVGLRAQWLWTPEERDAAGIDPEATVNAFGRDLLLLHPIKLSRDEALVRKISYVARSKTCSNRSATSMVNRS